MQIKDVRDHRLENRMESFFLAETTKYLYLLFDPDNFLHNNGSRGDLIHTPNGNCVINAGGYVFNTEAHPIDLAAVHCCSAQKKQEEIILQSFHDNLNLVELLDIVHDRETKIIGKKLKLKKKKNGKASEKAGGDLKNAKVRRDAEGEHVIGRSHAETKVHLPAGPGDPPQPGDEVASRNTEHKENTLSAPHADIKTTIVKTQLPSTDELPTQAAASTEDKPTEPQSSSTSNLPPKVNSEKDSTENGRLKQSFDIAKQLLDLFSTVTKQGGEKEGKDTKVPNVADLYASLKDYSIAYASKPAIMRCPSQPFHSRLSVWGEMFEAEDIPPEW